MTKPILTRERATRSTDFILTTLVLSLLLPITCFGADFSIKTVEKPPPVEIDPAIAKLLQPRTLQLIEGDKPIWEFWFCSATPLQATPQSVAKSLDAIKSTTLFGVAVVRDGQRDYKNNEIPPGVYTLRFLLQPQDGNHLGTAEYSYFVVLVQAKLDRKPDGLTDYKSLVKASSKDTSSDHPPVISLRPVIAPEANLPKLAEPAPEHKSIRLKLPAKVAGTSEETSVVFDLVFRGVGHI